MTTATPNRVQYVVVYMVLSEVGGVLLEADGTRIAVQQATTPEELIERLSASADPTADLVVVPGWHKAPEGLRERYESKRKVAGPVRVLTIEDEATIEQARRALGDL